MILLKDLSQRILTSDVSVQNLHLESDEASLKLCGDEFEFARHVPLEGDRRKTMMDSDIVVQNHGAAEIMECKGDIHGTFHTPKSTTECPKNQNLKRRWIVESHTAISPLQCRTSMIHRQNPGLPMTQSESDDDLCFRLEDLFSSGDQSYSLEDYVRCEKR